ncbi:MAG: sugar dehydrogenase [Actinobacteria bacterium]|uniref:Unannotated protein n=1 Tax=freshwater metagenome TaxID=449393 RepID=A0A6J6RB56_9ZZZZ|nr:sugar dehydrogenase [Actinomycetota bacterium]MSW77313.1 sugar dehydrogenase [Actinomycetota bacterium]MSX55225.1 sugar dehydrogenase [Actinomycetota bacterium]MSX92303.1 sugar dehydrogenase [Actinomycetota bacterium]MSZ82756.1 sugar dehydrogenase [Actinomycetota bacterium]
MRRVGGTHHTGAASLTAAALLLAACSSDGTSRDTSLATSTTVRTPESTAPSVTEASTAPTPPPPPSTAPLAASMVTFTTAAIGLDRPVDLTFREGDPALYIVQQGGTIVPLLNGTTGTPVLDISDLVSRGGEQGLLGMAFHPTKPLAYVDYTDVDGNTVIAEYSLEPNGQFDTASERTVLTVRQPYPNHNGGKLLFGNDGLLYIGLGDGGAANDPQRRGQNLSELLGKILRIDPTPDGTKAYTIPADNPFASVGGARGEIWAYGLRNPWRFDFDRATGDLWIADVGQNEIEEIDVGWATEGGGRGLNFGWSAFEGSKRFNPDQPADGVTPPVFEYTHGDDGCSISGGTVYRGTEIPSLAGWYVFSDYCSGKVRAIRTAPGQTEAELVDFGVQGSISAVASGPDGDVYLLDLGGSRVVRLART